MNAEQVRVRVLGTSFNVNTYDKDYIETVLVKGRVGLQMEGNTQEWQISPMNWLVMIEKIKRWK